MEAESPRRSLGPRPKVGRALGGPVTAMALPFAASFAADRSSFAAFMEASAAFLKKSWEFTMCCFRNCLCFRNFFSFSLQARPGDLTGLSARQASICGFSDVFYMVDSSHAKVRFIVIFG